MDTVTTEYEHPRAVIRAFRGDTFALEATTHHDSGQWHLEPRFHPEGDDVAITTSLLRDILDAMNEVEKTLTQNITKENQPWAS